MIELECVRLASDGAGVGYHEGKATFVPGLLPGETGLVQITQVNKNWQRGKLLELLKTSEESLRIDPPCTVFGICGGCQLQHLSYPETLVWKRRWVEDSLKRIGKINLEKVIIHPTIGMEDPWRYRNKARLHLGEEGRLGYYQEKSNSTVPFPDCLLLSKSMNSWIKEWEKVLVSFAPDAKAVTFRENSQGEGMLILEPLPHKAAVTELKELLNSHQNRPKIVSLWGVDKQGIPVLLWGKEEFREKIMGLSFQVSPLAFLQVNPLQTKRLYGTVLQWAELSRDMVVWDLYSGIGTITLALAGQAQKVWGIEENPYAVKDAKYNAGLNGLDNVEFIAGKVEDVFQEIEDRPDLVVLDPPRAGAHPRVLERLIKERPEKIIYVSCDPGTLARDLGILEQGGYQVKEVQPVDMFSWTSHVECIVLITRAETRMG